MKIDTMPDDPRWVEVLAQAERAVEALRDVVMDQRATIAALRSQVERMRAAIEKARGSV